MNDATSGDDLLIHRRAAVAPLQVPAHRVCRTWALSPGRDRRQVAERLVAEVVEQWSLPSLRSQRWLAAAADLLAGPADLELCVQLDRISQLVTLELWSDSHVVFGIDDWVGV